MTSERPKILVIVDQGESPLNFQEALAPSFDVQVSENPDHALELIVATQPRLVVMAFRNGHQNPLAMAQALRNPQHRLLSYAIGIIYLSHREINEWFDRALAAGIDLCLGSQPTIPLLHSAIRSTLQMCENRQELQDAVQRLGRAHERLKKFALTDELTGLYNMRFLSRQLRNEFKRAQRYQKHLSLLVLNLDNFAGVNDSFGKQVGSDLITRVGQDIGDSVRFEIDYTARWSADEFGILLPETDLVGAISVAERLRRTVEDIRMEISPGLRITGSVGVAHFNGERGNFLAPEELVHTAHQAVQFAKDNGGNQYCAMDEIGEGEEGQSA